MSLKIIRPEFSDPASAAAVLVSSNVAAGGGAGTSEWNSATAYAIGARVTMPGGLVIYEAAAANTNVSPPADVATATVPKWLEVSAINKFKMFDTSASTVTVNAESIDVVLTSARGDSLYLGGLEAQHLTVVQTAVFTGEELYRHEEDLTLQNVFDWYAYFYEPIIRKTDVILTDMPSAGGSTIHVTLAAPLSVAKCGTLIIGKAREVGELQWKPRFRLLDYSRKEKDQFGNLKLVPRPNARLISGELFISAGQFDEVNRLISEYLAQVVLWSGSTEDGSFATLNVLGFMRDFDHVLDSPAGSFCNFEIEGLI